MLQVLKHIFNNKGINIAINRREMKEMIKLCTRDFQFSFNGTTYVQNDGVSVSWLLASVLTGIFMVELKRAII